MPTNEQTKKSWLVIEFEIDPTDEDTAGWVMIQAGALGCEVRTGDDGRAVLQATFDAETFPAGDIAPVGAALVEHGLGASLANLQTRNIYEEDWLVKWKEGFAPLPIGNRVLICPPWRYDTLSPELTAGRKVILIEPGLAFGTGFHFTTQFCLKSLEGLVTQSKRILDVGTGSGILSIASALLNCECEIIALETDPLACRVAAENFELNKVSERITLMEGSTDKLPVGAQFDLILSNLTYEVIASLLDDYMKLLAPGGKMIFAGLLTERMPLLRPLLDKHQLKIVAEESVPTWVGLVVARTL